VVRNKRNKQIPLVVVVITVQITETKIKDLLYELLEDW